MKNLLALLMLAMSSAVFAQMPPPDSVGPGVSQELAVWRAAHYSDVRYKLNLTLEKMSPVLKGHMEIRVKLSEPPASAGGQSGGGVPSIILDWRKLPGHEKDSTVTNITLNEIPLFNGDQHPEGLAPSPAFKYHESNDHLILPDAIKAGENVVKLDFTSPILTSGSAITRYIDKEDGSEYIYSLFVPSDASTAFPVFDQPDLKARFETQFILPESWRVISNTQSIPFASIDYVDIPGVKQPEHAKSLLCPETKPISTYVFAFAAGPFAEFSESGTTGGDATVRERATPPGTRETVPPIQPPSDLVILGQNSPKGMLPNGRVSAHTKTKLENLEQTFGVTERDKISIAATSGIDTSSNSPTLNSHVYVRKSQAEKFKPHAAETFRLMREGIKYFEGYFDYKFPFPKYDLVLIPEFPFGGMEHAGATFVREQSIIFPTEPTKSDYINRATLIFHETAHQWFGDTVTMKWFDDLWLKEGFANFMAYKAMEKIMPETNAWKVFYERIKQPAYATDSTKGTTAIYQPIKNLSAAKSAYGNIVYNKAPAFLRQAEFYLGEDKFQTAVRAFLKKHEYANATWEDLVKEFEAASRKDLKEWAKIWVAQKGLAIIRSRMVNNGACLVQTGSLLETDSWSMNLNLAAERGYDDHHLDISDIQLVRSARNMPGRTPADKIFNRNEVCWDESDSPSAKYVFPNYQDYGYGIFLLDDKSRDYILKNVQNEKDPFLRSMKYGALWDSVREAELDPKVYVELAIKNLGDGDAKARASARAVDDRGATETDETIIQALLARASTAINYYLPAPDTALADARASASRDLRTRLENVLIERMKNAPTMGQKITFYRAFLNIAASENARKVLKMMLKAEPSASADGFLNGGTKNPPAYAGGSASVATENARAIPLKTKDKFDIVTHLAILGDPEASQLLADLEKTETTDDAKRYAYAAHAAFATKENHEKFWNDFTTNKQISESWIEAAMGPFNSIRHDALSLPYLQRALAELPSLKRDRKIFFVNGWLGAFIGGQKSQQALDTVNKFLADNPNLDNDLRLKILENVDVIERAVKIRTKYRGN